ncbi:hypothetical protein RFI_23854 [Reticulomyxa filosa]|uniref:Uncharacterized protein n=1 Tax=Reticulomyxa filosa TaxID=46433 RepID=X6MI23_RETFI|nr:hypothetical protein RFI_23854 [Reticulomyxa filosa]|eukprot:ETO13514.1 hypothetical protein RFI_23854 [Reticulomyxa filosa]
MHWLLLSKQIDTMRQLLCRIECLIINNIDVCQMFLDSVVDEQSQKLFKKAIPQEYFGHLKKLKLHHGSLHPYLLETESEAMSKKVLTLLTMLMPRNCSLVQSIEFSNIVIHTKHYNQYLKWLASCVALNTFTASNLRFIGWLYIYVYTYIYILFFFFGLIYVCKQIKGKEEFIDPMLAVLARYCKQTITTISLKRCRVSDKALEPFNKLLSHHLGHLSIVECHGYSNDLFYALGKKQLSLCANHKLSEYRTNGLDQSQLVSHIEKFSFTFVISTEDYRFFSSNPTASSTDKDCVTYTLQMDWTSFFKQVGSTLQAFSCCCIHQNEIFDPSKHEASRQNRNSDDSSSAGADIQPVYVSEKNKPLFKISSMRDDSQSSQSDQETPSSGLSWLKYRGCIDVSFFTQMATFCHQLKHVDVKGWMFKSIPKEKYETLLSNTQRVVTGVATPPVQQQEQLINSNANSNSSDSNSDNNSNNNNNNNNNNNEKKFTIDKLKKYDFSSDQMNVVGTPPTTKPKSIQKIRVIKRQTIDEDSGNSSDDDSDHDESHARQCTSNARGACGRFPTSRRVPYIAPSVHVRR